MIKRSLLPLMLLLPMVAFAAPDHLVLIRFTGDAPEKYVSALVGMMSGDGVGLRSMVSSLGPDAKDQDVVKEARRFGCDVVLSAVITTDADGRDNVAWSLASPDEQRPRASGTVTKPKPTWPAAADVYWVFLVDPITKETGASAKPWPQPPVSEQAEFTVIAKPHTWVSGLPGGPVTIDGTGTLKVQLNLPVSISLEGHILGWVTKPVRVFVDHPDQQVTLDQIPWPRWSLDVALNNFTFPSFGAEWRPWSGLVTRFVVDQYLGGLLFSNNSTGKLTLPVQSLPLATVQFGLAWDWSWPEEQVRFYSGIDVGARFMFPQLATIALEPLAPYTIEPFVGWEYRWTPGQALYFESGAALLWVAHAIEFTASQPAHAQSFQINIPATPLYLSLPFQAKVGYRWFF